MHSCSFQVNVDGTVRQPHKSTCFYYTILLVTASSGREAFGAVSSYTVGVLGGGSEGETVNGRSHAGHPRFYPAAPCTRTTTTYLLRRSGWSNCSILVAIRNDAR